MKNYWAERSALKKLMTKKALQKLRNSTPSSSHCDLSKTTTKKDEYEKLYIALHSASHKMVAGGGEFPVWLAIPTWVATLFSKVTGQQYTPNKNEVEYIGTLNNLFRLYVDPDSPKDVILIGSKWKINGEPLHMDMMTVQS